jgi:hypothetical protein
MIPVKTLDYELSVKIGDPKEDNGDGTLFHAINRLKYLKRAYGKLIRLLDLSMRKYKPNFSSPTVIFKKDLSKVDIRELAKGISFSTQFKVIDEVIIKYKTKWLQPSSLEPNHYLKTKYGLDEINKPSVEDGKENLFYSIIDNKIFILPEVEGYVEINAIGTEDFDEISLDTDLPITNDYADLFISLAAAEAMTDLPHPQKVQLYRQEVVDQISVLAAYTQIKERREGESNG